MKYTFRLEKCRVNAQRGTGNNIRDADVLTFGVIVGARQYGPLKTYNLLGPDPGSELDLTTYPGLRSSADGAQHTGAFWEIGPIEVADGEVASVNYAIVNVYHTLQDGSPQTATEVATISWATLVGITAGVFGGPPGAVVAVLAGGLAAAGGLFLQDVPNCDGVVGGNKRSFTSAELREATSNDQRTTMVADQSVNADAPDHCSRSDVVLTFSITAVPLESMKEFLISKFDLNRITTHWTAPFRGFTGAPGFFHNKFYSGATTSARDVIETFELRLID